MSDNNDPFGHKGQATLYRKFRPTYPKSLISYLETLLIKNGNERNIAVDVGCGSGQFTFELANYYKFKKVIGLDTSKKQLSQARKHNNIQYELDDMDNSYMFNYLKSNSIDLITICQAFHWFDIPKMLSLFGRILKKDGLLFILGYGTLSIDKLRYPIFHNIFRNYYENTLGSIYKPNHDRCYWLIDRSLVDYGFKDVNFLKFMDPIHSNSKYREWFYQSKDFTKTELFGYLQSWSGYRGYITKHKMDYNFQDPMINLKKVFDQETISNGNDIDQVKIKCNVPFFAITLKNQNKISKL